MKEKPPKRALQFLRWFCREDYLEEIEGDLVEVFKKNFKESPRSAQWKFTWSVVKYFRPEFMKSFKNNEHNAYAMYKSYFKVGWRNLMRNKGYSMINIGGLAIGMMVAILNGLWIWHEFSYNKYFENYDRIAQVSEMGLDHERGGTRLGTTMTYPLGTTLIENYSDHLKGIARTTFSVENILSANDKIITSRGRFVDPSAPEMFSFRMLQGSRGALSQTHSLLISKSLSDALFGSLDPINQTVRLNNKTDVVVAGVFEDFPQNTEFNGLKFFGSWDLYLSLNKWIEERALTNWRNHFIRIYVEIPEGKTFQAVNSQVKTALQFDPQDIERATRNEQELYLYPMHDWHLHPAGLNYGQLEPMLMLKWVGAIGAFVLLLACINFVNLSTARAEKRAKEVGIRKTIGSIRSQLVSQFFSESFLIVFFAFLFAIALTVLLLPGFNEISSKNISMPWTNTWFWIAGFAFVLLTSVLAGTYPALYLSSFNPIKALKGTFRTGRLATIPRKVLVVFQFCIFYYPDYWYCRCL